MEYRMNPPRSPVFKCGLESVFDDLLYLCFSVRVVRTTPIIRPDVARQRPPSCGFRLLAQKADVDEGRVRRFPRRSCLVYALTIMHYFHSSYITYAMGHTPFVEPP